MSDTKFFLGFAVFVILMVGMFQVTDMIKTQQVTDRYNTCVTAGGEFQRDGRDFSCNLP